MSQRDRAVVLRPAVVRRGRGDEAARDEVALMGGSRSGRNAGRGRRELDGRPARLVHLPAALVGASHPRVVLPGRDFTVALEGPAAPTRRLGGARAGPRRPRHLVLLELWPFPPSAGPRTRRNTGHSSRRRGRHRVRLIYFWVARGIIVAGYEYMASGLPVPECPISPASSATNRAARCRRASAT